MSSAASRVRLVILAAAGTAVAVAAAGFVVLYLSVPPGWSPTCGFAPDIGRVFRPFFAYPTVELDAPTFRRVALALLLGMWALHAGLAFVLGRLDHPEERRRAIWLLAGLAVAARALLVLVPPTLSTDLYHYALFGRMVAVYGLDPYVTPATAISADPLWPLASWQFLASHYGPTFTWISAGLTAFARGDPLATALAFKGAAALVDLFSCWAVWRLAVTGGDRDGLQPLALYALNPLVLVEFAANGHCDAFMICAALAGLLVGRRRPVAGMALLVLSFTVKYPSGVLALLFAAHAIFNERGAAARARMAVRLGATSAALLLALYAPFWQGLAGFTTTVDLVVRGRAIAAAGAPPSRDTVAILRLVLFAVAVSLATALAPRLPRARLPELGAALITLFVLFVFSWRLPWYFTTAIALTASAPPTASNRASRLVALWLGCVSTLLYTALVPVGPRL